jgi:two-component system, response regulator PdtaR
VKRKFLIVEDEVIIAMVLKEKILEIGFPECFIATNGEGAVRLFRREDPEFVLMDICLGGGIDGVETARRLKAINPSVRIIFMSGYDDIRTKARAMETGPVDFIVKPVDDATISDVLGKYLNKPDASDLQPPPEAPAGRAGDAACR